VHLSRNGITRFDNQPIFAARHLGNLAFKTISGQNRRDARYQVACYRQCAANRYASRRCHPEIHGAVKPPVKVTPENCRRNGHKFCVESTELSLKCVQTVGAP
jgi:hypothetical protein